MQFFRYTGAHAALIGALLLCAGCDTKKEMSSDQKQKMMQMQQMQSKNAPANGVNRKGMGPPPGTPGAPPRAGSAAPGAPPAGPPH